MANQKDTQKYLQLFNYLLDFAKLREKIVRKVEDYEECIWFSEIPEEEGYMCITSDKIEDKERPDWIKIKKPKEPKYPHIPLELKNWIVRDDLFDLDTPPPLLETIEDRGSKIHISEKPKILEIYDDFIENSWIPWSIEEKDYRSKAELYKKFFNLYEKSKKFGEEFELLVSIGLLYFQNEDSVYIKRHVLVANATLEFIADRGIYTVNIGADGAKLRVETEMLQDLQYGNVSNYHKEFEQSLEELELTESPFSTQISKLLETFVNKIHPKSEYFCTLKFASETPKFPTIFFAPALILRKRTLKSLSTLYQNIIEFIKNNNIVDLQLINDLIETDDNIGENPDERIEAINEVYTDIYFPKVYNNEQIQIIDRLRTKKQILVQGPPGTGKSHTIANLISHLLAHGKTMLITAYTKRALTVLKNQLPKEIKPLCINLLGNDAESINDLESSVDNIIKKFDERTEQEYKNNIDNLRNSLIQYKKNEKELDQRLLNIKEIDTRKHNINDFYQGSMLEIAKKIDEDSDKYSWFKDEINNLEEAVLNIDKLVTMVQEHNIYKDIENKFDFVLYNGKILNNDDLSNLETAKKNLLEFNSIYSNEILEKVQKEFDRLNGNQINDLEKYIYELLNIKHGIDNCRFKWSNIATEECLTGFSKTWIDIYETTTNILTKEFKNKVEFFEKSHKFQYPQKISKQQINSDANIFISHFESGKKIKKIKILNNKEIRERWYLQTQVFVNGSRCDTLEEYKLLKEYVDLELEIEYLKRIWSDLIDFKDSNYRQFLEIEKNRLELEKIIEYTIEISDLKTRISKISKNLFVTLDEKILKNILFNITLCRLHDKFENINLAKEEVLKQLRTFNRNDKAHKIYKDIIKAIEDEDSLYYNHCIEDLSSIKDEYDKYHKYKQLKEILKGYFPNLIDSLDLNILDLNVFNQDSLKRTFAWVNAKNFVDDHLRKNSYEETLENLSETENDIFQTTSELASERAWYFLFKNMSGQQRKHLIAWKTAMIKIGKGTGKNAWKFRKEAQKQMDQCRTSIPAWIMPLYRITETIKPIPGMFDYVIIDEASQAGPDALFLLFIAKNIIIVGDNKQTAPEYIGIQVEAVDQIIQKNLKNFPFAQFYGLASSFYDLAKIFIESRGGKVTLREHFRCMPEIIEFSNKNFYEPFGNSLFPLKQYSEKRLEPIKTTYVNDGFSEGTSATIYNLVEAKAICDTIESCLKNEKYINKSIGVISLRGMNQAQRIEKMLFDKIGPEEMEKRKIICGNSASFQGDERDIIFLSMVIDGKRNFRALVAEPDKRRFNVAASRAKEQIWLFHSVRLEELTNKEDLRYLLLDYYLNPKSYEYPSISLPNKFDYDKDPPSPFGSWFEVEIYNELSKLGYKIVPQYPVSKYRIDLGLIFPNGSKIAIECDGDKFHGLEEYQNDIMRQKILERCGWQFIRIRGCEYYSNKTKTINNVIEFLSDLGYEQTQNGFISESSESRTQNIAPTPVEAEKHQEDYLKVKTEEALNDNINNTDEILTTPKDANTAKTDLSSAINTNAKVDIASLVGWFNSTDSEIWFSFSALGKEKNILTPMERSFAFSMGRYRKRNWTPTEKQLNFAKRVFEKINNTIRKDEDQEKLDF